MTTSIDLTPLLSSLVPVEAATSDDLAEVRLLSAGGAALLPRTDLALAVDMGGGRAAAAGLKPDRTFGPFRSADGDLWYFDLVPPVPGMAVFVGGNSVPALLLPVAHPTVDASGQVDLQIGPGSVWVHAPLLDPAAPVDGYLGCRVGEGRLILEAATTEGTGDAVAMRVAAPLRGILDLVLAAPDDVPAPPPGGNEAATLRAAPPEKLRFTFDGAAAVATSGGSAEAYGNGFTFADGAGARWDPDLEVIEVPYAAVDPPLWRGTTMRSQLVGFDGDAEVLAVGWVQPVVPMSSAATLGAASGAGFWLLRTAPLRASWPGITSNVLLPDPEVLIGQGVLLLRCPVVEVSDPLLEQRLSLYGVGSPGAAVGELCAAVPIRIRMRCRSTAAATTPSSRARPHRLERKRPRPRRRHGRRCRPARQGRASASLTSHYSSYLDAHLSVGFWAQCSTRVYVAGTWSLPRF